MAPVTILSNTMFIFNNPNQGNTFTSQICNVGGWLSYSMAASGFVNNNWILTSLTFTISAAGAMWNFIMVEKYQAISVAVAVFIVYLMVIFQAYFCEKKFK
jgi:hypothetical protein